MPLASPSDSTASLTSNETLLAAARSERTVTDAACDSLQKTQQLTQALATRMLDLTAVSAEKLPEYLNKHLASAQHDPSPWIAQTISVD